MIFLRKQAPFRILPQLLLLLVLSASAFPQTVQPAPSAKPDIQAYIASGWDTLTRSMKQCNSVVDPKILAAPVLYLPAGFPFPAAVRDLQKQCNVDVERLPKTLQGPGEIDPASLQPPGLLYLENPYVVPGGRFNEMYGWDSYFIIRGLIEDGRIALARGMVENFFFEIEHYGAVLNANRTYYLPRSQPPFLSSMILAVYEAQKEPKAKENLTWLARAYSYAVRDHALWVRAPHGAGTTGLSRYYDFGNGPAPESLKDEVDFYRQVTDYFTSHPSEGRKFLGKDKAGHTILTPDYYKGDRAMRESGFDISFRFGPYGAATHHYAPVCLNSLLYKTEKDLQHISELLGRKEEARSWAQQAETRKKNMQKYLWDAQRGLFFDYDFSTGKRSTYEYVTTFYPLWAGLATPEQAQAVVKNLPLFEQAGGLLMSRRETGVQWDYPYGWAPTQMLAIEGLRRYGFQDDANRLSRKFLTMVEENFDRDGTIREKYNVVTRSSETPVRAGYQQNVVGFGWTNGTYLVLRHALPAGKGAETLP
ncbi:MAG: trehalase [Acidobacteria bacterium]|nr:trehalase [Acidobacteriota bacterium]